ncbi:hypothetical protein V8E55_007112 [Tylopilus felleus]
MNPSIRVLCAVHEKGKVWQRVGYAKGSTATPIVRSSRRIPSILASPTNIPISAHCNENKEVPSATSLNVTNALVRVNLASIILGKGMTDNSIQMRPRCQTTSARHEFTLVPTNVHSVAR